MRGFALVFDDPVAARTMEDKEWPLGQSKLPFLFLHSMGRAMGQFSFSHLDHTACIFTLIKAETLGFQLCIIQIISQASPVLKGFSSNSN